MEWYVSTAAAFCGDGTKAHPFRTITEALSFVTPGDTVFVSPGVYREQVNPLRGGRIDAPVRIISEIRGGAIISGTEVVSGFYREGEGVYRLDLAEPDLYGHVYGVFSDGKALFPVPDKNAFQTVRGGRFPVDMPSDSPGVFYAEEAQNGCVLYVYMGEREPEATLMEVQFRTHSFYADTGQADYITLSGFVLRGTAGCRDAKGWTVEDCEITDALSDGLFFSGAKSAYHTVRRCHIHGCGGAGIRIAPSAKSIDICLNHIHDCMAGIGAEGAVDVTVRNSRINHCHTGIRLANGAQGVILAGNLLHDNGTRSEKGGDLSFDAVCGPVGIVSSLLLSNVCASLYAQGVLFANNLLNGVFRLRRDSARMAPYFRRHTTHPAGEARIGAGDVVVARNIFLSGGTRVFEDTAPRPLNTEDSRPVQAFSNVYLQDATPARGETGAVETGIRRVHFDLTEDADGNVVLETDLYDHVPSRVSVVTLFDGRMRARIPDQSYADPARAFLLREDYTGASDAGCSFAGPFLHPSERMVVFDSTRTGEKELHASADETMKEFRMENLKCAFALLNGAFSSEVFIRGNLAWIRPLKAGALRETDCAYGITKTLERWTMEADETMEVSAREEYGLIEEAVVLLCGVLSNERELSVAKRTELMSRAERLFAPHGITMRLTDRYLKFVGEGERRFLTLEEVIRTLRHRLVNQVAEVVD